MQSDGLPVVLSSQPHPYPSYTTSNFERENLQDSGGGYLECGQQLPSGFRCLWTETVGAVDGVWYHRAVGLGAVTMGQQGTGGRNSTPQNPWPYL